MSEYGIYSKFDIQKHKETFTNYLEVVIDSDGTIEYAVPSHLQKITAMACRKLGISEFDLSAMCPRKYYCDYITWLCIEAGAVSVWNDFCIAPRPTRKQIAALKALKLNGLYAGTIPRIPKKE